MSYGSILFMKIDTHFHIFSKENTQVENSRYPITYDAKVDEWFKEAKKYDITAGVIVQPSFLGFDNRLLVETINQFPDNFRGVASVDSTASRHTLEELKNRGIKGIRLNLFGAVDPLEEIKKNLNLITHLIDLNMHLQIHHDDGLLDDLLLIIPPSINIVIDHFGRPQTNTEFEENESGINKHEGNIWVKLSAAYRTPNISHKKIYKYWLNKIGSSHLLWGSDWPHTNFESSQSYKDQINSFNSLIDDDNIKEKILCKNPVDLYWG